MGQSVDCNCVPAPTTSLPQKSRYTTQKKKTKRHDPREKGTTDSDGYDTDSSTSSSSSSCSSSSSSSSSSYTSASSSSSTTSYSCSEDDEHKAKLINSKSSSSTKSRHKHAQNHIDHKQHDAQIHHIAAYSQPINTESLRINVHSQPVHNVKINHNAYNANQYYANFNHNEPLTPQSPAHSETLSMLSPMISPMTRFRGSDPQAFYPKQQQVISPPYFVSHRARARVRNARSMSDHNLGQHVQLKPMRNVPEMHSMLGQHSSSLSNMVSVYRDKTKDNLHKSRKSNMLTKDTLDGWSNERMDLEQDAMQKELSFLKEYENNEMDSEQQAMEKELEYLKIFSNHITISPMASDYV